MQLTNILDSIADLVVKKINFRDCLIKNLAIDYRKITSNDLFFCISKEEFVDMNITPPQEVYLKAIKNGAVAIISNSQLELVIPKNIVWIQVSKEYLAMALVVKNFFRDPFKKTKIIGTIGTNGKTTTNQLLRSVLTDFQQKTASVGTLGIICDQKHLDTSLTTPTALELYEGLSFFPDLSYLIMENTSHASYFQRTASWEFDLLIFTNLTPDHLDFHHSWTNYKQSKLDYFYNLKKQKKKAIALINKDDAAYQEFCDAVGVKSNKQILYTYSLVDKNADFLAKVLTTSNKGSCYKVFYRGKYLGSINFSIAGLFNVYNSLVAFCACYLLGFPTEQIICYLEKISNIPGRFEKIPNNFGIDVFVDYAHSADSLENVLTSIHKNLITKGKKLITLFGCGGDRDKNKRPVMGKIAAKWSDFVVLTNDNPRAEPAIDIIADIQKGIPLQKQDKIFVIKDRRQAIYFALQMAKPDDIVLVAGKGHENYQIIGNDKNYFLDKEVVLDFFNAKKDD